ncbi:hypothetical protein HPB47_025137 [Ixodes persulcatus]|uniref:Uncharacterized protein n=1 Tax=Ixodes persulcatus TaxID=34615 RepID=A0AC60Q2V1_IXOPE|nr:hypothetical protein HPB47_025137 [Ixodes persulcatus]
MYPSTSLFSAARLADMPNSLSRTSSSKGHRGIPERLDDMPGDGEQSTWRRAKQWGPDHGQPVLALHDWFDNAASFEPLVAFLKPEFRIVSLDLTGHGLSSHLPPGSNYSRDRYVEDVLRAVDYLRWDTYAIVGHGMGAGVGYFLGSLQPERVPRLVSLEGDRLREGRIEDLRRPERNGVVYEDISEELQRCGVVKSKDQIHHKIENLTNT